MGNCIRLLGQHNRICTVHGYRLPAVCILIKFLLPAVVHTLKTGDLTLLLKKKAFTGEGRGGARTVMGGTVCVQMDATFQQKSP